jgi:signal transduction histidine kinase
MDPSADDRSDRPGFETLVLGLAHAFYGLPDRHVEREIESALGQVATQVGLDSATLVVHEGDSFESGRRFIWNAEPRNDFRWSVPDEQAPWSAQQLKLGSTVEFSALAELPLEAAADRAAYEHQGIRSLCAVPVSVGGRSNGILALAARSHEVDLPAWLASGQRLVGEILCGTLLRARAAEQMLERDQLMNLMAEATGLGIWELEENRVRMSDSARVLLRLQHPSEDLDGLLSSTHVDDRDRVRVAIANALSGEDALDIRYRVLEAEDGVRWVSARGRADPVETGRPSRLRAILLDVTARWVAQAELQEQRNELSHLNRLAMLSFLSGSFAHELRQPLTAILSNAQAGLRFLKATFIDRDELQEILADVVKEDERAGEVIRRLQALFERGESVQSLVNLNEAAREVIRLLHSDLVARSVLVVEELDRRLPMLLGDRVQLQQVVLNLVVNACEAMADNPPDERSLIMRTERLADNRQKLSVIDNGRGISLENLEQVFEPFFTTKPTGAGLGLVICRKIIAAHNGRLWAENNSAAGTTFSFELASGM